MCIYVCVYILYYTHAHTHTHTQPRRNTKVGLPVEQGGREAGSSEGRGTPVGGAGGAGGAGDILIPTVKDLNFRTAGPSSLRAALVCMS